MRIRTCQSSAPASVLDVPVGGVFRLAEKSDKAPILKIGRNTYFDLQNNCMIESLPNDWIVIPYGNAILDPCFPSPFRSERTREI